MKSSAFDRIKELNKKFGTHLFVLDGLRAIGILWIVWYHIWQQSWLSSNITIFGNYINIDLIPRTGYLGVELFLFVSGFGLFYSYRRKVLGQGKPDSLRKYFQRRFLRIYPSYLLAIILIILFFNPFTNISEAFYNIITHLFFIHNLSLQTFTAINGVFWILGVEVQFYLLFPLIARAFNKFPILTFVSMFLLAIVFRQVIQIYEASYLGIYLNQLPGFFDLYAFGMLAAYLLTKDYGKYLNDYKSKVVGTILSVFSVGLLLFLMNSLNSTPFAVNSSFIWQANNRQYLGIVFILFSIATVFSFKMWQRIFSNKILIFISTISYNLFIWHQFIAIQLKKNHIPPYITSDPHKDPVWQIQFTLIVVFISLLVAILLTYLFEKPIKEKGFKNYVRLIISYIKFAKARNKFLIK